MLERTVWLPRHHLNFGSQVFSTLVRLGAGAPTLEGDGIRLADRDTDLRIVRAAGRQGNVTEGLTMFLKRLQSDDFDDQKHVIEWLTEAVEGAAEGLDVGDENRLHFICGRGGTGKTELLRHVIRQAVENHVATVVVAPTNRAVKNLAKRCADIDTGNFVTFATAHSAFRALALNAIGEAIFDRVSHGSCEAVTVPGADEERLESANRVLFNAGQNPERFAKIVRQAQNIVTMTPRAATAVLERIGFEGVDDRVTTWTTRIGRAKLIVIDEIGMLSADFLQQALADPTAYVICAGDPGQLEPVSLEISDEGGSSSYVLPALALSTPKNTAYLSKSRRTGAGSIIPELADRALSDGFPEFVAALRNAAETSKDVRIFPSFHAIPRIDARDGLSIAYTHHRRAEAIRILRNLSGLPYDRLAPGDRLILTRRNDVADDIGLAKDEFLIYVGPGDLDPNGSADRRHILRAESGETFHAPMLALHDPNFPKQEQARKTHQDYIARLAENTPFTTASSFVTAPCLMVCPAPCITIHKAQGHQAQVVNFDLRSIADLMAALDEPDATPGFLGRPWSKWRRLAYTAVSRTAGRLNVIV